MQKKKTKEFTRSGRDRTTNRHARRAGIGKKKPDRKLFRGKREHRTRTSRPHKHIIERERERRKKEDKKNGCRYPGHDRAICFRLRAPRCFLSLSFSLSSSSFSSSTFWISRRRNNCGDDLEGERAARGKEKDVERERKKENCPQGTGDTSARAVHARQV